MKAGAIRQLGYVAPDLEETALKWVRQVGAGPFFLIDGMTLAGWSYRGEPQDMKLDIAFGQAGDVMIELIRPVGSWPNVYGAEMPSEGCVPHHHGYLVEDIDGAASSVDGPLITRASMSDTLELRYFDCRASLGLFVELITDNAESRAFFDFALQAARDWDGHTDPFRPFAPEG